jgi:hypothetical protein
VGESNRGETAFSHTTRHVECVFQFFRLQKARRVVIFVDTHHTGDILYTWKGVTGLLCLKIVCVLPFDYCISLFM